MPDTPDHFLLICATCRGALPVAAMRDALAGQLPKRFAIRTVECMAGCAQPTTVGFQAADKAQYLFGGIQTPDELAALAAFAHQYLNSTDGWTSATDRPRPLFSKTLSRLPRLPQEAPA